MRRLLGFVALLQFVLLACDQATTKESASGSPSGAPSSSAVATTSARASGSAAASASTSAKQIDLQVVAPENGAKAGVNGIGWTVDVIAKGSGPAMDKIKPGIRGGGSAGMHPSFPGLVILIKSSAQSQSLNANANLAGLFQIVGLPNTLGPTAAISSVATSASASPAGTAATRTTTSTDNETAEATWFVDQSMWGTDVDVELTAFVVDGDAPATVSDRGSLKIVSNEITVRFHINAGANGPAGSAKPSASGAPAASPSGSARPSASPSSTP